MAQQLIYLGTTDNDGTGTKLKLGGDMINDNFTEVYGLIISGCCVGDKYTALRSGIKACGLSNMLDRQLYFISSFKVATSHTAPNIYEYTLDISRIGNATATGATLVSRYTVYASALKTGWELLNLTAQGTGGSAGFIVVDWDVLGSAVTYTCTNWQQGGLYAIAPVAASGGGTGGGTAIDTIATAATVDGSSSFMLIDSAIAVNIAIDKMEDIQGPIELKNIGAGTATLQQSENKMIDGYLTIDLRTGDYIKIIPNPGAAKFEAVGQYVGSNP